MNEANDMVTTSGGRRQGYNGPDASLVNPLNIAGSLIVPRTATRCLPATRRGEEALCRGKLCVVAHATTKLPPPALEFKQKSEDRKEK